MELILKSKCPVCGRENEAPATVNVSRLKTMVYASFLCTGGCKTSYSLDATDETAERLIKAMICGGAG